MSEKHIGYVSVLYKSSGRKVVCFQLFSLLKSKTHVKCLLIFSYPKTRSLAYFIPGSRTRRDIFLKAMSYFTKKRYLTCTIPPKKTENKKNTQGVKSFKT